MLYNLSKATTTFENGVVTMSGRNSVAPNVDIDIESIDDVIANSTDSLSVTEGGVTNSSLDNWYPYGDYYYYYYYPYDDLIYEIFPFEVVGLGIVWPILVILTAVANVFVIGFFLLRNNRGKPTNLLFVSIAISDTMTGIVTLPMAIHVYAQKNIIITEDWCRAIMILRFYVSQVFHTVSVWQTLLLGVQRYMCVCHPFIPSRWFNLRKTLCVIAFIYIFAMVLHCYHIIDDKIMVENCEWHQVSDCTEFCIYLWMCVVFLHLFPCFLLVFLTIRTLSGLSKAKKRVLNMARGSTNSRTARDKQITRTVALVVIVFLIPELPQGLYKMALVINSHRRSYLSPITNHIVIMTYELVLVLSFHANFWIYCFMIHDFRTAIVKLFSTSRLSRGMMRLRSMSSRSSGSIRSMMSRTSSLGSNRNRIHSTATNVPSTSDGFHGAMPMSPTSDQNCSFNGLGKRADDITEMNDDVFI